MCFSKYDCRAMGRLSLGPTVVVGRLSLTYGTTVFGAVCRRGRLSSGRLSLGTGVPDIFEITACKGPLVSGAYNFKHLWVDKTKNTEGGSGFDL